MDFNNELKKFLTTTGTEWVEVIKERDRLIKERDRLIKERDRLIKERDRLIKEEEEISYLLCEHLKKFTEVEKKMEDSMTKLVSCINKVNSPEEITRKCSEFEQYKRFRRN